MPSSTNPRLLENVICYAAEDCPKPLQIPAGTGQLSSQSGWPAITSVPLEAGGVAPQRQYSNTIIRLFYAYNSNANLTIIPGSNPAKINMDFEDPAHIPRYGIAARQGSVMLDSSSDNSLSGVIQYSGAFIAFARTVSKGSIIRATTYAVPITFTGSRTGKRYECLSGGTIEVSGAGAEFFPG